MSFDLEIGQILQYAFNIFGSLQGMIYLFVGASFGIWILFKILKAVKEN